MARENIDKARIRKLLQPRREPYWGAPLARGLYLGYRKLEQGGTWIARQRDEDGRQKYHSIGYEDFIEYEMGVKEARRWAKQLNAGIDTSKMRTVADACREYVEDRRCEKGDVAADDAENRYRRTVFSHSIGKLKLTKVRAKHIKQWRSDLGMAVASQNRNLTALKAALNYAVASKYIGTDKTTEWKSVKPHEVTTSRDLYLDRQQRATLVEAMPDYAKPFFRALCMLPLRPGALAHALVGDLDLVQGMLTVRIDKAGAGRKVALFPGALDLLRIQASSKLADAPLIAFPDGTRWDKDRWKLPVNSAAEAAKFHAETCAYTLRHSVITDMLVGGIDTLTVARIAGTSILMIERHYGHLLGKHAADAMGRLEL